MSRRRVLSVAVAILVFVCTAVALARPGGGQSYSGSSSSSSGSSGSSGGGGGDEVIGILFELLLWLCIEHPAIGIPLVIGVAIALLLMNVSTKVSDAWDSSSISSASDLRQRMKSAEQELEAQRADRTLSAFERIKNHDPEFSSALFEDFLYSLFAEVHAARGAGTLDRLSPYLSSTALPGLGRGNATRVEAVVIGSLRCRNVTGVGDENALRIGVTVDFHANYTEIEGEESHTYYVVETWQLSRNKRARSRPPKRARTIDCPNCGAPLDKIVNSICTFCHAAVSSGDFDWMVDEVGVATREERPPALTGDVEERGTERPTLVDPQAQSRFQALEGQDNAVTFPLLEARVRLIFTELQRGWNARNLLLSRAYLSDRLFETLGYWLDAYERAGLVNVTENSHVTRVELSRVMKDVHFDSVTLRVFATGLDYTLDGAQKVVSGSRRKEREYSEYWTLIRGAAVKGPPRTEPTCPNCGAPLDINRTGNCNQCRAEVTSGDFDWVLSKIEQDDDYA